MSESTRVDVQPPCHDTLIFEAIVPAPPEVIFALYADVALREQWSAPSPTAIVRYEVADLRSGGCDVYVCGDKEDPRYRGVVHYCDVSAPGRLVFSETISQAGQAMFSSLTTWLIEPAEPALVGSSRLTLTVQLTSLVGPAAARGVRVGTTSMLANLERLAATRADLS